MPPLCWDAVHTILPLETWKVSRWHEKMTQPEKTRCLLTLGRTSDLLCLNYPFHQTAHISALLCENHTWTRLFSHTLNHRRPQAICSNTLSCKSLLPAGTEFLRRVLKANNFHSLHRLLGFTQSLWSQRPVIFISFGLFVLFPFDEMSPV